MRILITGGAGFIGRHLTNHLHSEGHWVRWLDNLDPQVHGPDAIEYPSYCHQADEMYLGNVIVRDDWQKALRGVDAVIHLAAQTGTGQSMYQIEQYATTNIGGTALLWDVLANEATHVNKVLIASSRSIYGEGAYLCSALCGQVVPEPRTREQFQNDEWEVRCPHCSGCVQAMATPESSFPKPASLYACTKLAQEQMSLTMGKALGISTAILRFQNVYGPGQSLRNPYTGIISIFSNQLRQSLPVNVYEDGKESRDFVLVDDVARLSIRLLELAHSSAVFNVGSGQAITILDLAHMLKRLWNSPSPITISGDFRVGDIRHNWADCTNLQHTWPNWQPTPISEGLNCFVSWAKEQPVFEDLTQIAVAELKMKNI